MKGLLWILGCRLAGQLLSEWTGGHVSGNIFGMVLLFAALSLGWADAEKVRPVARFLLGSMALFFVPYGVGLIESYGILLEHLGAIVAAAVVSTCIVLLVTGHAFQYTDRLLHRRSTNKRN